MERKSFEPFEVLRRAGGGELVRYRCFRVLPDNKYWVQGADRFQLPLSEAQKQELTDESTRALNAVPFGAGGEVSDGLGQTYDTLDEAIMAFEQTYSNR
jgi:hypothetical protein